MNTRVAVAQISATPSVEHNLRQAADQIAQARLSGCALLCLPHSFDFVVDDPSHALSLSSSPHSHPLLARYHALSAQADLWLSLGGVHTLSPNDPTKLHLTHFLLSPHDPFSPVAVYNVAHLPTSSFPNHPPADQHVLPGDSLVVAHNTPLGTIGLSHSHDLHYPSVFTALRDAGATTMLIPSMIPTVQSNLWHPLVQARAIETQSYVIAAAQAGSHSPHRHSYGHSLIVSPAGDVLADAGPHFPTLVHADLDLARLHHLRNLMPLRKCRRDDLLGVAPKASTRSN